MNLTLLATEGFGLNFNLFETNILNWAVVVFGLYKFLPSFLGKMPVSYTHLTLPTIYSV